MGFDSGARVRILAPTQQPTVRRNAVSTAVSITHFRLDCALAGTANRKGVGHYHIELDHSLICRRSDRRRPCTPAPRPGAPRTLRAEDR
jgi:hypothetical protein